MPPSPTTVSPLPRRHCHLMAARARRVRGSGTQGRNHHAPRKLQSMRRVIAVPFWHQEQGTPHCSKVRCPQARRSAAVDDPAESSRRLRAGTGAPCSPLPSPPFVLSARPPPQCYTNHACVSIAVLVLIACWCGSIQYRLRGKSSTRHCARLQRQAPGWRGDGHTDTHQIQYT